MATRSSPSIIVLALWPAATPPEIDRRVEEYSHQYPDTKIQLLYESARDSTSGKDLCPSVSQSDTILLHIYGESAAAETCKLLRRYYSTTGKPLHVTTVMFDLDPTSSQPLQLLSSIPARIWSWVTSLLDEPLYDRGTWIRRDLEDPSVLSATAKRVFTSTRDRCEVTARAVEEARAMPGLAWKSESNGYVDVRCRIG